MDAFRLLLFVKSEGFKAPCESVLRFNDQLKLNPQAGTFIYSPRRTLICSKPRNRLKKSNNIREKVSLNPSSTQLQLQKTPQNTRM